MVVLVLGGAASGKSEYAESLVLQQKGTRFYLATMENRGETARKRIARHRALRAEKGFLTIEQSKNIECAPIEENSVVLLECLSNLFANEMYSQYPPRPAMEVAHEIKQGIEALSHRAKDLIIVSNNIFDDGVSYDPESMEYMEGLSWLNAELASGADAVIEVVCSIPIIHKQTGAVKI